MSDLNDPHLLQTGYLWTVVNRPNRLDAAFVEACRVELELRFTADEQAGGDLRQRTAKLADSPK